MTSILITTSIIVILVIIIYFCNQNAKSLNDYIDGFYEGDEEFLERANLTHFYLLLTHNKEGAQVGSILINGADDNDSDDTIIENTVFEITIHKKLLTTRRDYIVYDCEIHKPIATLPDKFKMSLSYMSGTLSLYDDENVYAILTKDLSNCN